MIHPRNHSQTMKVKARKKSLEQRLGSKDREEFWAAVEELEMNSHFMKEFKRIVKSLA